MMASTSNGPRHRDRGAFRVRGPDDLDAWHLVQGLTHALSEQLGIFNQKYTHHTHLQKGA